MRRSRIFLLNPPSLHSIFWCWDQVPRQYVMRGSVMSSFHPLTWSLLLTRIKFSFRLHFQLPRCLFLLLLLSKAEAGSQHESLKLHDGNNGLRNWVLYPIPLVRVWDCLCCPILSSPGWKYKRLNQVMRAQFSLRLKGRYLLFPLDSYKERWKKKMKARSFTGKWRDFQGSNFYNRLIFFSQFCSFKS